MYPELDVFFAQHFDSYAILVESLHSQFLLFVRLQHERLEGAFAQLPADDAFDFGTVGEEVDSSALAGISDHYVVVGGVLHPHHDNRVAEGILGGKRADGAALVIAVTKRCEPT